MRQGEAACERLGRLTVQLEPRRRIRPPRAGRQPGRPAWPPRPPLRPGPSPERLARTTRSPTPSSWGPLPGPFRKASPGNGFGVRPFPGHVPAHFAPGKKRLAGSPHSLGHGRIATLERSVAANARRRPLHRCIAELGLARQRGHITSSRHWSSILNAGELVDPRARWARARSRAISTCPSTRYRRSHPALLLNLRDVGRVEADDAQGNGPAGRASWSADHEEGSPASARTR